MFFFLKKGDPSYISVYLRESGAEVEHGGHGADGETDDLSRGKSLN